MYLIELIHSRLKLFRGLIFVQISSRDRYLHFRIINIRTQFTTKLINCFDIKISVMVIFSRERKAGERQLHRIMRKFPAKPS